MNVLKPSIRFLRLQAMPIYQQLQLEEVLLRLDMHNSYCIINHSHMSKEHIDHSHMSKEHIDHSVQVITGIAGKIPELVDTEQTER